MAGSVPTSKPESRLERSGRARHHCSNRCPSNQSPLTMPSGCSACQGRLGRIPQGARRLSREMGGMVPTSSWEPTRARLNPRSSCSRSPWRRRSPPPLKEIGVDPDVDLVITLRQGRFGPYVTDGTYNASLRRGDDPESLTLARAAELLAEKRAAGPPASKRGRGRAGAKKAP